MSSERDMIGPSQERSVSNKSEEVEDSVESLLSVEYSKFSNFA